MSKCNITDCELNQYQNHDKCILHCKKETHHDTNPSIIQERDDFYNQIKDHIAGKHIRLVKIAFPWVNSKPEKYQILLNNLASIDFDTCYFYDKLELDNPEVFFQNCHFYTDWHLFDYKCLKNIDNVIYSRCTFHENVKIRRNSDEREEKRLSNSQFNYYCKFHRKLTFSGICIGENIFNNNQNNFLNDKDNLGIKLEFNNCTFETNQEFYLANNANTDFLFNGCEFKEKLKIRNIDNGNYETLQKHKAKLKQLKIIDCTVGDNSYLRIGFLSVGTFELSNLRNQPNAELNIGDCHFQSFKLTNFRNIGKFKLYKINILKDEYNKQNDNPKFQIDNTSIGSTDFQSINLASFAKVVMFDNIFSNIDYTNMQWQKNIEVGQFNGIDTTEIAKKRDTYRTLKNVAQRNNDQPQALIFYGHEMKNHKELTCLNKDKKNNKIDIFILRFNDWTNKFGLNWFRPLFQLVIIALASYVFLLLTLGVPIQFIEHWKYLFEFLNPTHKTQFIAEGHWNFYTYAIDFIFRIVEGLWIYQTIVAFRKYSKKL